MGGGEDCVGRGRGRGWDDIEERGGLGGLDYMERRVYKYYSITLQYQRHSTAQHGSHQETRRSDNYIIQPRGLLLVSKT